MMFNSNKTNKTSLNSSTSKFSHNLAILPRFISPIGSTSTIFIRLQLIVIVIDLKNEGMQAGQPLIGHPFQN